MKKIKYIAIVVLVVLLGTIGYFVIDNKIKERDFILSVHKEVIAQHFCGLENTIKACEASGITIDESLKENIRKDLKKFAKKVNYYNMQFYNIVRIISALDYFEVDVDYEMYQDLIDRRYDPTTKAYRNYDKVDNGDNPGDPSNNGQLLLGLYDSDNIDISMADDVIIEALNTSNYEDSIGFYADLWAINMIDALDELDYETIETYYLDNKRELFLNPIPDKVLVITDYRFLWFSQQIFEGTDTYYNDMAEHFATFDNFESYFTGYESFMWLGIVQFQYEYDFLDNNEKFANNINTWLIENYSIVTNEIFVF